MVKCAECAHGWSHRSLDGRAIEKIALGIFDFGSFQDRAVLKRFLEATLNVKFGSSHVAYDNNCKKINAVLEAVQHRSCRKGENPPTILQFMVR